MKKFFVIGFGILFLLCLSAGTNLHAAEAPVATPSVSQATQSPEVAAIKSQIEEHRKAIQGLREEIKKHIDDVKVLHEKLRALGAEKIGEKEKKMEEKYQEKKAKLDEKYQEKKTKLEGIKKNISEKK